VRNPLALARLFTLQGSATELPAGRTLADVLPQDLYARFSALKARYFPRDSKIEKMWIGAAMETMERHILDHEKLERLRYIRVDSPPLITGKIRKWLGKNKSVRHTMTDYRTVHRASFRDIGTLDDLFKNVLASADFIAWSTGCLERAISYFENDLAPVKKRANAWAQGHADDLVSPTPLFDRSEACSNPPFSLALESSAAMVKLRKDNPALAAYLVEDPAPREAISRQKWLTAAEAALGRNTTTFALLPVNDVLDQDGLVAQLQAKGYTVEISAVRSE
jgi:hypothetical protein